MILFYLRVLYLLLPIDCVGSHKSYMLEFTSTYMKFCVLL